MRVKLGFLERQRAAHLGLLPETINPIIVVPGLLGSWPPAPAPIGRIDPIANVYTNLIDGLQAIGYKLGVSLFIFPYDWRRNVNDSAQHLKQEIQRIRELSNSKILAQSAFKIDYSKVDLIAHSLGGLIARAYVQSDDYQNDVARIMTVATPHTGLLAAYYAWEGGDSTYIGLPIEAARSMVHILETREMPTVWKRLHSTYLILRKQLTADLYAYLTERAPVVQDLLPTADQNYLYELAENGEKRFYPCGYPENSFLEKLNSPESLLRLAKLEAFQVFYGSAVRTPIKAIVADCYKEIQPLYKHGKPIAEQPAENFGNGDDIIPALSGSFPMPEEIAAQIPLQRIDLSKELNQLLGHVGIIGDPEPVRYLLNVIARNPSPGRITAEVWDGPLASKRRPNLVALFR